MKEEPAETLPRPLNEFELAWYEANRTKLRRLVSGQGILYRSLAICFVLGLIAHVGGYLLESSMTGQPLGLIGDLLHAIGWSLWTGVVVVVFLEIFPELKRRQIAQALDAFEAARRSNRP